MKWNQVRDEDGKSFDPYKKRLNKIGLEHLNMWKCVQEEYQERRCAKMARDFRPGAEEAAKKSEKLLDE